MWGKRFFDYDKVSILIKSQNLCSTLYWNIKALEPLISETPCLEELSKVRTALY